MIYGRITPLPVTLIWVPEWHPELVERQRVKDGFGLAPGPGFEPGLEDSKSPVLPLDHPGKLLIRILQMNYNV